MKNNQFKKLIRKKIEEECKLLDFISVYVDDTNNSRFIYIYTVDYKYCGIFYYWLNNESVHLRFTPLKSLKLTEYVFKDVRVNYTEVNQVLEAIEECFNCMDSVH